MMRSQSRKIALCGVLCALATAILLTGGLLPLATFCAPLLAMVVLLPLLEEYGPRTAAAAYGAVALLGLLLAADREMALVYLVFGWYPLLRPRIAVLPSRLLRTLCRLAVCSGLIALLYGAAKALLGPDLAESPVSGLLLASLLFMGNVTFLLLDRTLSRLSTLWQSKLRHRFLPRA